MTGVNRIVAEFGSLEIKAPVRLVEIGGLSFALDGESVRSIKWRGVEVVRAIAWPIRNPDWITLAQEVHSEKFEQDESGVSYTLQFSVADGALECSLELRATPEGKLSAELAMTPTVDFATNRSGFTVLHPIAGVAGTPLELRHSDASVQATSFPLLISPDQPAMDIVGMHHNVAGLDVDLAFSGEIFEMEDQRNWTDASYKTYCVPLVFPFTYTLAAGKKVCQKIDLTVAGDPETGATVLADKLAFSQLREVIPEIALSVEEGWLCSPDHTQLLRQTGVTSLQVRTGPEHKPGYLAAAAALALELGAKTDVEIVVSDESDPSANLVNAKNSIESAGLSADHVLALPQAYLGSFQPSGPWPGGVTPGEVLTAVREVFAETRIGGGVLSNFAEFNRCRPDASECDFISHGTTAIVHASDDLSVLETLETLPQIFASAHDIGQAKPYRLGLVSIAMRSNPYGAAVADNLGQVRQAMAIFDPRQRGLFGAAFAVGVLAASESHSVDCLALAAPSGPFGIISEEQPVPRPYFDDTPAACVYPIFHVIRAAAAMQGKSRYAIENLSQGLQGVAAKDGRSVRLMIANLGHSPEQLILPGSPERSTIHILDVSTFETAVYSADWLDGGTAPTGGIVQLDPYAILFATMAEPN